MGWSEDPDAVEAEFDTGEALELIGEDRAAVGEAVVIGVFEDDDAIAEGEIEADFGFTVGVIFGDPEASLGVGGDGDGLLDLGFAGEEGGGEAWGGADGGEGLGGGDGLTGLGIEGGGEGGGESGGKNGEKGEEDGEDGDGGGVVKDAGEREHRSSEIKRRGRGEVEN